MAGMGPPPKSAATRQRRNKVAGAAMMSGQGTRIKLPAKLPEPHVVTIIVDDVAIQQIRPWHPACVLMWKRIRRSPMREEWIESDLDGLLLLMELEDRFWYGDTKLAAEIRLQRQCFGLTPIDRRRLQWEVQKVEEGEKRRHVGNVAPAKLEDARKYLQALS